MPAHTDSPTAADVTVRPVAPQDHDPWAGLFAAYRAFYRFEPSAEVVERVWGWLLDEAHELGGLVAVASDGRLLGIAHHRPFSRPSSATTGLWLDDLFTAPEARGRGVGRALIARLTELANERGHTLVRWITAPDNATAQRLYDDIAARRWVAYDLDPTSAPAPASARQSGE